MSFEVVTSKTESCTASPGVAAELAGEFVAAERAVCALDTGSSNNSGATTVTNRALVHG
jgi:hypothetical protein